MTARYICAPASSVKSAKFSIRSRTFFDVPAPHSTPAHVYRRRRLLAGLISLVILGALVRIGTSTFENFSRAGNQILETVIPTPVDPCPDANPFPADFVSAWTSAHNAVDYQAVAYNPETDCTYLIGSSTGVYPTASTVKLLIATSILEKVTAGTLVLADVRSDLELMITISSNEAAQRLWTTAGGKQIVAQIANEYGLQHTTAGKKWGTTQTNAEDQVSLFKQVVLTKPASLSDETWNLLRTLLASVDAEQHWGAGYGLPDGWTFMVKNGWYHTAPGDDGPENKSRVNTVGAAVDPTGKARWVFSGYSNTWDTDAQGIDAWNALSSQLVAAWGN